MTGLTIPSAAKTIGISEWRLRRMISKEGCPVVCRGERGRGKRTLVDPEAVKAWCGDDVQSNDNRGMTAEQISELVAEGAWRALPDTDNPKVKAVIAEYLVKAWYFTASAAYDLEGHWTEPALPDRIKHMNGMTGKPLK